MVVVGKWLLLVSSGLTAYFLTIFEGNWKLAKLKLERDVVALEPFGEGIPQFFILSYQLGNAPELCDLQNLKICDCDYLFLIVAYALSIITTVAGIVKFLIAGPFPMILLGLFVNNNH